MIRLGLSLITSCYVENELVLLPQKEGGMKSALKGVVEIWLEQNFSLNPVILNLHFFYYNYSAITYVSLIYCGLDIHFCVLI